MRSKSWEVILGKIDKFSIKKGITSFVNPYSMLLLKKEDQIAMGIDYWYVDGISLVNKINSSYNKKIQRYSFDDTSLAPLVFEYARKADLKIAIIGTEERYIERAVDTLRSRYSVNILYSRNGYFKNENEKKSCIQHIINKKIELVICGMGTPYQEKFLIQLKNSGWNGYGFTCGGYLHQIAKKTNYYPSVFDKLNIRWVYRIIDEPKLIKRYAIDYPRFFLSFSRFKNIRNL